MEITFSAQGVKDVKIKDDTKTEVINEMIRLIEHRYLFPDTATRMKEFFSDRLASGDYSEIKTAKELASAVSRDFSGNFFDKHMRLKYNPKICGDDWVD